MSEHNYKEFFKEAMNQIEESYIASGMENDFRLYFNLEYVEDTISEITVSVASEFMWQRMIQKGNVKKIQERINELTGQNIAIKHIINSKSQQNYISAPIDTKKNTSISSYNKTPEKKLQQHAVHPQLIEEFTFENFVPGDNSQYAYSACIAAAKEPGNKNYNPILLYGFSGLGKTHLMISIGNYIFKNNPSSKISYLTTESFMNEFTSAIREKTTDKFTKKYRKLDVLLLDDIQFLEGKEALQNELFYTFDDIYNRKGQLVFTCDRPISEIKGIADRLRTRFARGLSIDLKAPDYETRLAIIDKKLENQGKIISQDVKEFIAKNIQSNVRELEGTLSKAIGYADLLHKELNLDIIKELLSDSLNSFQTKAITIDLIQKTVCNYYNISLSDLKSSTRKKTISNPRHIAIYLARQLTEYSLTELGEEFGGRDHTTILSSIKKIEDYLKTDSTVADTLTILEKQMREI